MRPSTLVNAAAVLSLLGAVGCGGAAIPASAVVPEDPTPLAKCDIAKSNARPLVTEWPASEKAHLESLLADQAVVVSYSGCEMRLLDGCRIDGEYEFRRTTIAEDTVEITNADELYAKVPLGAASLEGELSATGRLAINTTVVGQLRLSGDVAVPNKTACKEATHVIRSISIGAFEMTSGGKVQGRGGVSVGDAGAGVKSSSKESSLKSAGDRGACQRTEDREPHPDCRAPLQVFLESVEVGKTGAVVPVAVKKPTTKPEPVASKSGEPIFKRPKPGYKHQPKPEPSPPPPPPSPEPEQVPEPKPVVRPTPRPKPKPALPRATKPWDEPPADKSVTVRFEPPDGGDGERWILMSPTGEVLCNQLPCQRRVGNRAGIKVQLDADRKEDIRTYPVPADLGYTPGRTVRAVPVMPRPRWIAPTIIVGVSAAVLGGGIGMIVGSKSGGDDASSTSSSSSSSSVCDDASNGGLCTAGLIFTGAGVIGITTGAVWFLVVGLGNSSNEGKLDITLVDDASAGLRIDLAPNGLVGTF